MLADELFETRKLLESRFSSNAGVLIKIEY